MRLPHCVPLASAPPLDLHLNILLLCIEQYCFCVLNAPNLQVLARPRHVSMDNLIAAAAIYNSLYSLPDDQGGGVCATFQIVSLSGWVGFLFHAYFAMFRFNMQFVRCLTQVSRRPKRAGVQGSA